MRQLRFRSLFRCLPALLVALLAAGCATSPELEQSRRLQLEGRHAEALALLERASQAQPADGELRLARLRARELALSHWRVTADDAAAAGRLDEARRGYEQALAIEPNDTRARAGLVSVQQRRQLDEQVAQAEAQAREGRLAEAEAALRAVLLRDAGHGGARRALARLRERQLNADLTPPALKGALTVPVTLELRDTPLRNAFDVLARSAGLNFVFDRDVRADARVSITVRQSPLGDVVRLLLATQQLERKVLNENSLLIYPATPAKLREYQDLTARVFYLANADAKQAQGLLRTLGKIREVHIDEKLNLVAIRDSADAVRLAERLIAAIDIAEPEVMLEVEILEIGRTRARDLGIRFPEEVNLQARLPLPGSVPAGVIDLLDNRLVATVANPALRLGLKSQDTDVNLLANPRIRAKNREKAKILIGEKLPVFTTTTVQNAGVASSVSYLDVGLKLEVEPNVFLEDEVGIKVALEVNSNLERITGPDGSTAFRLGTRTAQTTLRLKDGETQVLAGLIKDEERDTFSKLPGLGDLPVLGRAFGNTARSGDKSEIVLLITPRILRNITPPEASSLLLAAGTEVAAGAPPLLISPTPARSLSIAPAATAGAAAPGAPAARPEAASPEPPAATVAPAGPSLQLRAPPEVSIGRDFVVRVELSGGGDASGGDAVLQFDPSLIGGGSGGRAVVQLTPAGEGRLAGSITLRALAAGSGETRLEVVGGSLRAGDGAQRSVGHGSAVLRIGL